jgi:hypothetical protein
LAKYVFVVLMYQTTGPDALLHFGIIAWLIAFAGVAATAAVNDAVVSTKTAIPLNIFCTCSSSKPDSGQRHGAAALDPSRAIPRLSRA